MIFDSINRLYKYQNIHKGIGIILKFLEENDCEAMEKGKYNLSDEIHVNIDEYTTHKNNVFEAHRKYIDLQYMLKGNEIVYYKSIEDMVSSEEYNPISDIEYFKDPVEKESSIVLAQGKFIFFYPEDLHAPANRLTSEYNKKLVFKIPAF